MRNLIAIAVFIATAAVALGEVKDAATRERGRVLVDTNATTTVTLYLPAGAGQLLSGKVGGTNAVWIATAATTNSWKKIAQD